MDHACPHDFCNYLCNPKYTWITHVSGNVSDVTLLFSPSLKIYKTKNYMQPWWPLLRFYYYADTSNRDMLGGERHHQQPYYAIMIDDMLPPSWLAHKTTSKMVHRSWHQNILLLYYVDHIIDKRLLWRYHLTTWSIYMYSCLEGTLWANLASPIQPKLTYIWYA